MPAPSMTVSSRWVSAVAAVVWGHMLPQAAVPVVSPGLPLPIARLAQAMLVLWILKHIASQAVCPLPDFAQRGILPPEEILLNRLVLDIAGIKIAVTATEPGFLLNRHEFKKFVCANSDAVDCSVQFFFHASPNSYRFLAGGLKEKKKILRIELQKKVVGFPGPACNNVIFYANCAQCYFDEYNSLIVYAPFIEKPYLKLAAALMNLLCTLAARTDGIFLHGAGCVIDGRALTILGVPGAGKSTAIAMIRHEFLLSDDMLMLRFKDGEAILHSTPLGPNSDGPGSAPLGAVFFPVHSDYFAIRPLTRLRAIELYYRAQSGYWEKVFTPYRKMHFDKVCQLFAQVKAYEMHFPVNYIDNAAIRRTMENS